MTKEEMIKWLEESEQWVKEMNLKYGIVEDTE